MALIAAEIESSDPDSWTGKLTSLTYESESTVSTWLNRRGLTAFSSSSAGDQETALILATESAEEEIRADFRGAEVTEDQGLLLPARGAYGGNRRLIADDEAPRQYLEGIRLIAEHRRAGTWMPKGTTGAGIKVERTRKGSIEYQDGIDATSMALQHPDIWSRLQSALPGFV